MKIIGYIIKGLILMVLGAMVINMIFDSGILRNIAGFIWGYNVPRIVLFLDELMGALPPKKEGRQ